MFSRGTCTVTLAGLSVQHLLITTDLCRSRNSLRRTKPAQRAWFIGDAIFLRVLT
jgi:hypothetical protein